MRWIDSHCHLTSDALFDQADAVLTRASAAGVVACLSISTDLADAADLLALAARNPMVRVAAGIHPHEAGKVGDDWLPELEAIVRRPDVLAGGEMGLDYHYDFAERTAQRRVFEAQLALAERAAKPIIIHCREAHRDVMDMLASAAPKTKVVFHCFTGTTAEADEILAAGYWISLTGVVTFKSSAELRDIARRVPADRLMVETDSPYLSPEPVRSVRPNEPAFVVHTGRCIAAARREPAESFAARMTANTIRFFGMTGLAADGQPFDE